LIGEFATVFSGSSQSGDAAGLLAIFATYGLLRERLGGPPLSRRRCLVLGALAGLAQSILFLIVAFVYGAAQAATGEVTISEGLLYMMSRATGIVPMAPLGLFLRDLRQPHRR
jgi:hypothetical protein